MEQPLSDWGGPYLQAAFFSEKILQEADGVVSAIRIVDRINAQVTGVPPGEDLPPVLMNLTLFISFKSGEARGSHDLTIVMEPPSGLAGGQRLTQSVLFEGAEDRGTNITLPLAMNADQEGVYWFLVLLDDRLITRVPLRLVYLRQIRGTPGSSCWRTRPSW